MRSQQQREALQELYEKQTVLKAEADTLKLSIPEQRELLLAKARRTTAAESSEPARVTDEAVA